MAYSGSASYSANDFALECYGCPPGQFGIFYYGPNQILNSFGNGFRCVGGLTQRLYPITRANSYGTAARSLNLNAAPVLGTIVPGTAWNFQLWYRDQGGPGGNGFNVSDGLNVAFQ